MAKMFTVDNGRSFYNADQILKISAVNARVPDTLITFVDGNQVTSPLNMQETLNAIRAAE